MNKNKVEKQVKKQNVQKPNAPSVAFCIYYERPLSILYIIYIIFFISYIPSMYIYIYICQIFL